MSTTLSGRTLTTFPVKNAISAPDRWSVCTTSPVLSGRDGSPFVQASAPAALTRTLPSMPVKRATGPGPAGRGGFTKKKK